MRKKIGLDISMFDKNHNEINGNDLLESLMEIVNVIHSKNDWI